MKRKIGESNAKMPIAIPHLVSLGMRLAVANLQRLGYEEAAGDLKSARAY